MKILFSLFALLVLTVSVANATLEGSYIGMFADVDATDCHTELTQYVYTSIYFYAYLDMVDISQTTAVEFKVGNWSLLSGIGVVTPDWDTPLAIGDPATDLALAFEPAREGPWVLLGTVEIFVTNPLGVDADTMLRILPGDDCNCRAIVDELFNTFEVDGNVFVFKCSVPDDCPCNINSPAQDLNWGAIKALY